MLPPPYTNKDWQNAFEESGYKQFDDWWNTEANLVETGNFRGADADQSWSHVSIVKLNNGCTVYLKRQQNHFPNNLFLKLRRISTFEIEWKNYQRLQQANIPTLNIIHFASRKTNGHHQTMIVSEELQDMTPIGDIIDLFNQNGWPERKQRLSILSAILKLIRKMHDAGIIHNALYHRHIYLNIPITDGKAIIPNAPEVRLIDLERTKFPGPDSPKLITHDLEKMYRRISEWPARDCLWFLKQYLHLKKLTPKAKKIARKIAATRES